MKIFCFSFPDNAPFVMTLLRPSVFIFALFSFGVYASIPSEDPLPSATVNLNLPIKAASPIENIFVYHSKYSFLSVQNLSNEEVEIEIYDKELVLPPDSGIQFECAGYENLVLLVKYNLHGHFEIPCQSRVVIDTAFEHQFKNRALK